MSESDAQTEPEQGERPEITAARQEAHARVRQRIADRIERTGITMQRLSDRSGVSKTTIYRLLQGEGDARLNTLAALAHVLLLDVRDLFDPLPGDD